MHVTGLVSAASRTHPDASPARLSILQLIRDAYRLRRELSAGRSRRPSTPGGGPLHDTLAGGTLLASGLGLPANGWSAASKFHRGAHRGSCPGRRARRLSSRDQASGAVKADCRGPVARMFAALQIA